MNFANFFRAFRNRFPVPSGSEIVGQAVAPSGGTSWKDGAVTANPTGGTYTSTTLLTDGSAGDTSTGVTGTGASIQVMVDAGLSISIASWELVLWYPGTVTVAYKYWDGSAWQAMVDGASPDWGSGDGETYASFTHTATFSAVPSARYFLAVATISTTASGNAKCTDSRVA